MRQHLGSRSDDFFDAPRTVHATSAGPVELPIRYFDVTNLVALFTVPHTAAAALLEEAGLAPARLPGGRAVVGLSFYDYRDTSIGPYGEVGTAIFAIRRGQAPPRRGFLDLLAPPRRRLLGAYVVDLPVTTPIASAAGRELWGYPKFVTDIEVAIRGRDVACAVADPDAPAGPALCALTGTLGVGLPAPALPLMTYTRRSGALIRTHVDVRGRNTLHAPGSVRLEVRGAHPMAERLRALGLAGTRPRAVLATDRFQSVLHAGTAVG